MEFPSFSRGWSDVCGLIPSGLIHSRKNAALTQDLEHCLDDIGVLFGADCSARFFTSKDRKKDFKEKLFKLWAKKVPDTTQAGLIDCHLLVTAEECAAMFFPTDVVFCAL